MEVVQLQGLPKREDVLGAVIADERLADGVLRGVATAVAERGQLLGVWLPATMARMMRIPVSPVMSVTTWCSCTFICISAFCMC